MWRKQSPSLCSLHVYSYMYKCIPQIPVNVCSVIAAAAAAKPLQSCPTLCNPIDGSPPGSPIPGILQARTLEWVAISFSSAWKWKVKVKLLSHVRLLATPWTAAYQAPLSTGFSRQEHWSDLSSPPGDLPNPGIEPSSLASPALAGGFFTIEPPGKPTYMYIHMHTHTPPQAYV